MHSVTVWAEILTVIALAATTLSYAVAYVTNAEPYTSWRSRLLLASIVLYTLFVGSYSGEHHHCLITSGLSVIALLGFIIGLIYAVLERVTKTQASGVFVVPVVFLLELASALFRIDGVPPSTKFGSLALNVHVATAVFGYAGISMAGMYGAMYLLLFRSIKRSTFGTAFERLPSLGALEDLSTWSLYIGLLFLTVTMLAGLVWLPLDVPDFTVADPKLLATCVLWALYVIALVARRAAHLEGKRMMQVTFAGFVFAMASLTLVNLVFAGFHRFS